MDLGLFADELVGYEAYYIMLCFATLTYAWNYPRKDRFALRLAALIVAGAVWQVLIAAFSAYTMDIIDSSLANVIKYSLCILYLLLILWAAYKMRFAEMLYFILFGLALWNLSTTLMGIIRLAAPALEDLPVIYDTLIFLGVFFVIYILNYLAFGKQLKSIRKMDVDIVNVIILGLAFGAGNVFLMIFIGMYEDNIAVLYLLYSVCFIYAVLLFVMDYLVLWRVKQRTQRKINEQLFSVEQKQFESLKRSMDAVNSRYHDLKYYVEMFEKSGAAPDNLEDLKQAVQDYGAQLNTGNRVLDIVFSDKNRVCQQNGIVFSCMVTADKMPDMADSDMYSLFGNALDNAIEYLCKVEPEKRLLNVRIRCKNVNFLLCDISNWCAMPPELTEEGTIATSKKDGGLHGVGLSNMRRIVDKYGGGMEIKYKDNFFHLYFTFRLPQSAPQPASEAASAAEAAE